MSSEYSPYDHSSEELAKVYLLNEAQYFDLEPYDDQIDITDKVSCFVNYWSQPGLSLLDSFYPSRRLPQRQQWKVLIDETVAQGREHMQDYPDVVHNLVLRDDIVGSLYEYCTARAAFRNEDPAKVAYNQAAYSRTVEFYFIRLAELIGGRQSHDQPSNLPQWKLIVSKMKPSSL